MTIDEFEKYFTNIERPENMTCSKMSMSEFEALEHLSDILLIEHLVITNTKYQPTDASMNVNSAGATFDENLNLKTSITSRINLLMNKLSLEGTVMSETQFRHKNKVENKLLNDDKKAELTEKINDAINNIDTAVNTAADVITDKTHHAYHRTRLVTEDLLTRAKNTDSIKLRAANKRLEQKTTYLHEQLRKARKLNEDLGKQLIDEKISHENTVISLKARLREYERRAEIRAAEKNSQEQRAAQRAIDDTHGVKPLPSERFEEFLSMSKNRINSSTESTLNKVEANVENPLARMFIKKVKKQIKNSE